MNKEANNAWDKYCEKQARENCNWINVAAGNACACLDFNCESYDVSMETMRAYAQKDGFYTKSDGEDRLWVSRNKTLFC
jgi:hypothetical protein